MHPTPENLPDAGGPIIRADTVLAGVSDPQRVAEWATARRGLLDAEVVTSIGSYDGPDILGIVGDAAVDEEGNIYIQENTLDELLVYTASGDLLHRVGGSGEGPEEFRGIRRFDRLPDGRLVVAHGGGPVKVMELVADRYEFTGPLTDPATEPPAVVDMCALGDRVFMHATNLGGGEHVVHEAAAEGGGLLASFAEGYRSDFVRDRVARSRGRIACGETPPTVVWGLYYFPIVEAYRPDNTRLWAALIEDFVQGPVYQNDAATPTVAPYGRPTEFITGVHALPPDFVILQTLYHERRPAPGKASERTRRRTYLVDRETGNGGLVSDGLPWIAWIGDSSFVTVPSEPFPKVEVRAFPGRAGPAIQEPATQEEEENDG